jgi:hypothetical protein
MTTNNLTYRTTRTFLQDGYIHQVDIKISLNDECKNGQEDFSITGDEYILNKTNTNRRYNSGGCIHDLIEQVAPEFKMFIDLHLNDFKGSPMYAIANGHYNLSRLTKEEFISYYLITEKEYTQLLTAENEDHFAYLVHTLDIPSTWAEKAEIAIKELERLTGEEFKSEATKQNYELNLDRFSEYIGKSLEEVKEMEVIKSEKLYQDNLDKKLAELKANRDKKTEEAEKEYYIKESIAKIIHPLKTNFIFYNHINKLVFNWMDWSDKFTTEEMAKFVLEFDNKYNIEIDKK